MVRENDIYRRGVLYEKTLRGRSTVIGLHITSKKPVEAKNYKCFSAWQNALTYLLEVECGVLGIDKCVDIIAELFERK